MLDSREGGAKTVVLSALLLLWGNIITLEWKSTWQLRYFCCSQN